jgi:hypothetical protein
MTVEADGGRYFLQVQIPPRRLIAIGAVHIAQSLVPMAASAATSSASAAGSAARSAPWTPRSPGCGASSSRNRVSRAIC